MKVIAVMLLRCIAGASLALSLSIVAVAGVSAGGTVIGRVVLAENGAPLSSVVLRVEATQVTARVQTVSDAAGRFRLSGIAAGQVTIVAGRFGLATKAFSVQVPGGDAGDSVEVLFRMTYGIFQAEEVVVTAKETRRDGEGGSTSRIERAAIEHVQASSVADVLQLVPGQVATNPTLSGVRQSLLRQAPTNADGDRANAFGTGLVLDGVPVSNNADLQTDVTILNSAPGTQPPFASASGRGLDLRQFSADNIESVEVIRGIPSARHGDLTAGAILIQTRAGEFAPQARVRLNPNTVESTLGRGWSFSEARTHFSADANFTASQDDPRRSEERFSRLTGQLVWTQRWAMRSKPDGASPSDLLLNPTLNGEQALTLNPATSAEAFVTTVRVGLFSTVDERQRYPEDTRTQQERFAQNRGGRFNIQAAWTPDERWRLDFTGSASLAQQRAFYKDLLSRNGVVALGTATTDTTTDGIYGGSEYVNETTVEGNPLNVYARVEAGHRLLPEGLGNGLRFNTVGGIEWRTDATSGSGRQFGITEPPRQNYSVGDRPRRYDDIPALHQLSLYVEERAQVEINGRRVNVQAGMRFDNIAPSSVFSGQYGAVLAPRLNVSVEAVQGVMLRGGFGVTAKSPSLSALFPGARYFDLISFNYFAPNPAERLLLMTTRVITPETSGLRPARNTKAELGLDLNFPALSASLTLFEERTAGALGTSRFPVALQYPVYRTLSAPLGQPPAVELERIDTVVGAYDSPVNSRDIFSRGIELSADFPEWKAVKTAVSLNGAWLWTRSTDAALFFNTDALFNTPAPKRIGVYDAGAGNESQRLVTGIRLIQRAPALQLILSLLVQTVWIERDRPVGIGTEAVGYIDKTGILTPLTPEQARLPENADLRRQVSEVSLREENRPALWLFNLRVTKELSSAVRFAFFVNNLWADRPLYSINRTASLTPVYQRRNEALFFGAELLVTL